MRLSKTGNPSRGDQKQRLQQNQEKETPNVRSQSKGERVKREFKRERERVQEREREFKRERGEKKEKEQTRRGGNSM